MGHGESKECGRALVLPMAEMKLLREIDGINGVLKCLSV